jgi:hypothetical protein
MTHETLIYFTPVSATMWGWSHVRRHAGQRRNGQRHNGKAEAPVTTAKLVVNRRATWVVLFE